MYAMLKMSGILSVIMLLWPVSGWTGDIEDSRKTATAWKHLEKAKDQVIIALNSAERSLAPHEPGSWWTRVHMQQVLNVLEGTRGKNFQEDVENPGDGHGVVRYLQAAQETFHDQSDLTEVQEILSHVMAYVEAAAHHAGRSIKGTTVAEVHEHARLAAGMLVAALGRDESSSPHTLGFGLLQKQEMQQKEDGRQ